MPYRGSQASKSVVAESVSVSIEADKSLVSPGDYVVFSGFVEVNGEGRGGITVYIMATHRDFGTVKIGEAVTQVSPAPGYYELRWSVPWRISGVKIPCKEIDFFAYLPDYRVRSDSVSVKIAYETRISISAPDRVREDSPFDVTGKLEYKDEDGWKGLAGKVVKLYVDDSEKATAQTDSYGNYKFTISLKAGTHTLKVVYPGEGITAFYLPSFAELWTSLTGMPVYLP